MAEFITITHPDLGDQTAEVTEKSYESVWKDKGWRRVTERARRRPAEEATKSEED